MPPVLRSGVASFAEMDLVTLVPFLCMTTQTFLLRELNKHTVKLLLVLDP